MPSNAASGKVDAWLAQTTAFTSSSTGRSGSSALLDGEPQRHLADGKSAEVLVFDLKRD